MKARVKRIKIGTIKETKGHRDTFEASMAFEGFMNFTPKTDKYEKIIRGWYDGTNYYSYHISWLKDIQE